MKSHSLLPILFGAIFVLLAAGSAEAQSCFDCVLESGSNPESRYCTGGSDFAACTTHSNYDPNTCQTYTTCANVYVCTTDSGGGGDDGGYCSSSNCNPNIRWEINTLQDLQEFMCYHYGTWCD